MLGGHPPDNLLWLGAVTLASPSEPGREGRINKHHLIHVRKELRLLKDYEVLSI